MALTNILLLAAGAVIGLVPTYVMERRRERHELATRWDTALYELCKDFSATVREFVHLARRYERSEDKAEHTAKVDERHAQLRRLAQELRLLGSKDLQQAVHEIEHHAWWVREVCEGRSDKLADYYAGRPPEERLRSAMSQLYIAARTQLGVANPRDIVSDEPIDPRKSANQDSQP
jgi:hypothetical protein